MRFRDKAKYSLMNPSEVFSYLYGYTLDLFLTKEQQAVNFFRRNYLHLDRKYLFEKLQEYWDKYRYFNEISKFIALGTPSFKNNKILDVGCGYTSVLNLFSEGERYGIDVTIEGLKKNKFPLSKKVKWINATAEDLPFKDNFFDIVFCANGLDHYSNPQRAIAEVGRVLKNKGVFILTLDVFNKDKGRRDRQHPHSYTEYKIINELANFKILFKEKSALCAQFCRFIKNKAMVSRDEKELILVTQLEK